MAIGPTIQAVVVVGLVLCGSAHAQSTTLRLGDDGAWVETDRPEAGSIEARLSEIRREMALGRAQRARDLANRLVGGLSADDPWYAAGKLILGDTKVAAGREYMALFQYEEIISRFPASPEYRLAVERELEIAIQYTHGYKRRVFWGMIRTGSAGNLGEELLIRVQERLPGSSAAERAGIELGDYYFRKRDMKMASDAYELFTVNYPASVHRQRAMQRRILANVAMFKGPRYDASGLIEAEALIEEFGDRFPLAAAETGLNEALMARLDESRGAQLLENAQWYLRREDGVSARFTLARILSGHPRSVAAARARTIMAERGWDVPLATAEDPIGPDAGEAMPVEAGDEATDDAATDDADGGGGS